MPLVTLRWVLRLAKPVLLQHGVCDGDRASELLRSAPDVGSVMKEAEQCERSCAVGRGEQEEGESSL